MTDNLRKWAAERLRELLDAHVLRKAAFLQVRQEVRDKLGGKRLPAQASLYAWCKRFEVSTR